MPRRTARIWKFFSVVNIDGEDKRKCLKCKALLPTPKDASTSNMINHLKKEGHDEQLKEYESDTEELNNNTKITSFFDQKKTIHERQREMDEQLVRIMVRQNASLSFFDDEDVQARTKMANPDLKVYGRWHYCKEVIPSMAKEIKKKIVQQIGDGYFSITSDGWQKPSKFPALLSVTTHSVNENFDRMDNVLATIPIEKEHTGEEIAKLIEQCLKTNRLKMDRLAAMVRDDAKNMQKSCRLLEIESFQCSAHFYHLIVIDALKSNQEIENVIRSVRQWVGGTHRSSLAELLKRFQKSEGIEQKKIPMDVPTRWNSTYLMLNAFMENRNALLKIQELLCETESSRKPQNISQRDWTALKRLATNLTLLKKEDFVIIKELCKILKVFHIETCRLSAEQSTAST
uniref:BED-type domain-containing protein n=1 Tax=Acrobeloides nanus TaxID=290746 RepID=A0A914DJW1_9BILA